ncbi:hypothetical protein MLD38_026204 [Melastoma candidum]|uniref:Uncharacterized protein n=1 Tax=Melastoma candidum TaxID=119954 RepID=A0ACB9NXV8_9MYRT|nr:hypothetical protein MLD38_026204 [Melastoma candidum]
MARISQDFAISSSSSSKRHHFPWPNSSAKKIRNDDDDSNEEGRGTSPPEPPPLSKSSSTKKPRSFSLSKLRAALLTALLLNKNRAGAGEGALPSRSPQLHLLDSGCRRAVGTLFGHRRGHVQFTLQRDAASRPTFFVELSMSIGSLVKEMASGLVRIALECDKDSNNGGGARSRGVRLLEELAWRACCNGRKCGFAKMKECGEKELRILRSIEPISMGAGVLPQPEGNEDGNDKGNVGDGGEGEGGMMYVRAKFERIVGSGDCEAYYMMNPDRNGAPELSIYLLRV